MQIIDATATTQALPFGRLIDALAALFATGCETPPRHVHTLSDPAGSGLTSLIMPAWVPGLYYGVKCINIAPGNAQRGLPGLHASYLLHDASTGVPLALIDGDVLTARRTAATSALAARFLARPDAKHLLVVGAGRIAALLPAAYRVVRPGLARISVWARSADAARALVDQLREQGQPVEVALNLEAAARCADIVSCATLATEPVIQGAWLRTGSHLDLIGSFTPAMREADDACLHGARLYVDTEEALQKSGDLIGPLSRGVLGPSGLRGTLADLCKGTVAGRLGPDERTVFKSVGMALGDLAAAMLVADQLGGPQNLPAVAPGSSSP